MATKISIPVALERRLRAIATGTAAGDWSDVARQLVARIDDARKRELKTKGLSLAEIVGAIRTAVPSAIMPPMVTTAFAAQICRRVNYLGCSAEDIERAAFKAKREYRQPVSVEYIVRTLDRLLAPEEALAEMREEESKGCEVDDELLFTGRDQ